MNICYSCEEEHGKHNTIFLGDIKPNIEDSKNNLLEIKKQIELFNVKVKEIIKKLNELIDTMNIYYEINNNILKSYDKQNRNYQILENIKEININNDIFKVVNKINNIPNIKNQIVEIIDLYNNINSDKDENISYNKPLEKASFLHKEGELDIYLFPSSKFIIGNSSISENEKTECLNKSKEINRKIFMLIGETNSGKTSLINSFINFLYDIHLHDNFRYIIAYEFGKEKQKLNSTKYINIYNLDSLKDKPPITIIDTPGFGDDIKLNEKLIKMMKELINNYIENIDAICIVSRSDKEKFTVEENNIFNNILSLFGNDIIKNIIPIFTINDIKHPLIKNFLLDNDSSFRKSIYNHIKDNEPWYLQFDISAIFKNDRNREYTKLIWELGIDSLQLLYNKFVNSLSKKSLCLSKSVIQSKENLGKKILSLRKKLEQTLAFIETIKSQIKDIEKYRKICKESSNYKIIRKVPELKKEELGPGIYGTTCLMCTYTCHTNCYIADDDQLKYCPAMDSNGYCTVCPKKCAWNCHKNRPYIIRDVIVEKEIILEDLKKKYYENKNKLSLSEKILKNKELEFEKKMEEIYFVDNEIQNYVNKLKVKTLFINSDQKNKDLFNQINKEIKYIEKFKNGWNNPNSSNKKDYNCFIF